MKSIKYKIKLTHNLLYKVILMLFISFALMPDLIKISGHSMKAMYIMLALLVGLILKKKKMKAPPKPILAIFVYMVLVSLIGAFSFGIDRLFFNYCFGIVVISIIMTLGVTYDEDYWLDILQKVWIFLVICVLVNDLSQIDMFMQYFEGWLNHPNIQTLVTGGVNLEATWIGILASSFYKSKKRWGAVFISLAYSLLYASRVGIIADAIVAFSFVYGRLPKEKKKKIFRRRVLFTVAGVIAVAVALVYGTSEGIMLSVLDRFADIGKDPGSLGRLAMWSYIPQSIVNHPLGVGLGNAIVALEEVSPFKYEENNVHNIYMQMFSDIGVLGGMFYLSLVVYFIWKERKHIINTPVILMLSIYFFIGLFQFRGGETITFCLMGTYFAMRKNKERKHYEVITNEGKSISNY